MFEIEMITKWTILYNSQKTTKIRNYFFGLFEYILCLQLIIQLLNIRIKI
jgi:hypothetical protein